MLIQLFPSNFIVLASISTLLKAISGMVNGTAKANTNRHFASAVRGKNLGDITAKGQSQGVFAYVIGLFYGVGISYMCQALGAPYLIIGNFVILNCWHLYSSYRSLSNLNIRFLNGQRGTIVTQNYLTELHKLSGGNFDNLENININVPTPRQVAEKEVFVRAHREEITVKMGTSVEQLMELSPGLEEILEHTKLDSHAYEPYLINANDSTIAIAFHEKASETDFIRAFLHSQVYIWCKQRETVDGTDTIWAESHKILQPCFPHYINCLKQAGWGTNFILFYEPGDTPRFQFDRKE